MDCSKTINFLHELQRLCDSRDVCEADAANKEGCPMLGLCDCSITTTCAEDAIKAVENLQKWSDEHSQKTYIQDFLEKFPKAEIDSDGSPFACRKEIYGRVCPKIEDCGYTGTCKNCWNEPMEE